MPFTWYDLASPPACDSCRSERTRWIEGALAEAALRRAGLESSQVRVSQCGACGDVHLFEDRPVLPASLTTRLAALPSLPTPTQGGSDEALAADARSPLQERVLKGPPS